MHAFFTFFILGLNSYLPLFNTQPLSGSSLKSLYTKSSYTAPHNLITQLLPSSLLVFTSYFMYCRVEHVCKYNTIVTFGISKTGSKTSDANEMLKCMTSMDE